MPLTARKIGQISVHPIGFGVMGLSVFYGATASDEERLKVLDRAHKLGCTHWDTADVYGDSEQLLGKWFKRTGKRCEIFLSTKLGVSASGIRGDAEYIRSQCMQSLQRMGVDYIDILPDPTTPIEISVQAMAQLVKEGKVKQIGLSEVTATGKRILIRCVVQAEKAITDLRRAYKIHPIAALQVEYNPFVLDIENPSIGILEAARSLGVTIVAYSPLARGLVTGRYKSPEDFEPDDFRLLIPKFSKDNFPKILEISNRIAQIGAGHHATPGQVTLAWILAQGSDFVVIPGTKNVKYLVENMKSEDLVLTTGEIAAIRNIAQDAEKIEGARVPEGLGAVLQPTPELSE
ncbi:hypothetical protein VKT23_017700 [Stygiomarasmius scandens]|uniref:NADP-dependent oxidoreductase domain-containing protein n=1 Tax=Marasmiellus scandens TaxID=2682957 RepID=A0ABR1IR04_9AGAR